MAGEPYTAARRWMRADERPARRPGAIATGVRRGARAGRLGGRQSGCGHGAVPWARQPEVPEDPLNDDGVVDGGEQLHPGS